MTTRYQTEHHEDVASVLREARRRDFNDPRMDWTKNSVADGIVQDFADLFAADNPPIGKPRSGFDRERFLAACGLES